MDLSRTWKAFEKSKTERNYIASCKSFGCRRLAFKIKPVRQVTNVVFMGFVSNACCTTSIFSPNPT